MRSIVRIAATLCPMASILPAIVVFVALTPAQAWAIDPGASSAIASAQSSEGDPDEASHQIVVADFNRDGIPDIAEAAMPDEDRTGPGALKVSLGQSDGTFKLIASY